jgi:hypothetical protein
MRRSGLGMIFLVGLMVSAGIGASPAAPSYQLIEQTIGKIRGDWAKPGAPAQPNAAGWNALFDAMVADLRSYAAAKTERDRLVSLSRLYQMSIALGSVGWRPAAELR